MSQPTVQHHNPAMFSDLQQQKMSTLLGLHLYSNYLEKSLQSLIYIGGISKDFVFSYSIWGGWIVKIRFFQDFFNFMCIDICLYMYVQHMCVVSWFLKLYVCSLAPDDNPPESQVIGLQIF